MGLFDGFFEKRICIYCKKKLTSPFYEIKKNKVAHLNCFYQEMMLRLNKTKSLIDFKGDIKVYLFSKGKIQKELDVNWIYHTKSEHNGQMFYDIKLIPKSSNKEFNKFHTLIVSQISQEMTLRLVSFNKYLKTTSREIERLVNAIAGGIQVHPDCFELGTIMVNNEEWSWKKVPKTIHLQLQINLD